jgi:hypothetical protein
MAKAAKQTTTKFTKIIRKKRPGIHSKKKFSKSKNSKNYQKINVGQG